MLISDRSKEIIENLMNANGPLTVAALAKKLNVTERTISVSYTHLTLPTKRIV